MSRWFRHYAGMMRDDKLVRVAIRSAQTIERVVWVYAAILESAAEIDDEGRYDFDAAEAAYFLRSSEDDVAAIVTALDVAGRLSGDRVVKWGDRQFKSDRAAERQARYRERKRNNDGSVPPFETQGDDNGDGQVTSLSRHRDAPETETETELDTEKEKPVAIATVKKNDARGTRLPDDWQPKPLIEKTAEMVAVWPTGMIERELSKFRDHWRKTPGARGRSLDWDASFRNWLRNADERKPRNGRQSETSKIRGTLDQLFPADQREGSESGIAGLPHPGRTAQPWH